MIVIPLKDIIYLVILGICLLILAGYYLTAYIKTKLKKGGIKR